MSGLSEAIRPSRAHGPQSPPAGRPADPTLAAATDRPATRALIAAWTLIGLGIGAHDGEWSAWGLAALLLAFVLLLAVAASGRPVGAPERRDLGAALAVSLVAACVHPAYRLMHVRGAGVVAIDVLAAVTVAAAAASLVLRAGGGARQNARQRAWWTVAGLAAATGIVTIVVVPDPHIDVWYLLQQSSDGLLHGQDMYRQHWAHSHGLQAIYPYLPWTTVLLAPFRWLTTDVRAGLLLASLLTSWQLRRLAPLAPPALALLVLTHPHWAFLVDQSWTEPLLLVLLTAAVLAVSRGRPGLAVLALAGALACKQHVVLLLPLFAAWPAFGLRRTAQSAALAFAAVLPWLVWSPHQFWHDAVKANLDLGVIPRALCVPSLLLRHGIEVGFWFTVLALAVTYAVALVRVPRTASGVALGSALVLLALDLTNKQSFFNHYTLPLGLLVVALAAGSAERRTT
jgi:hypothetical protein